MYFSLQGWLVYTCCVLAPCPLTRTLRKFSAVVLAQHYGDTAEIRASGDRASQSDA